MAKTVRFTRVVEAAGRPEVYLLLDAPEKDAAFQRALKAGRVMTLHHGAGRTDFGTVGYDPGGHGQVLVFPRPLRRFGDGRIVGIDYDLLHEEHGAPRKSRPTPKSRRAAPSKSRLLEKEPSGPPSAPEREPEKVIPFASPDAPAGDDEDEAVAELKAAVRRALRALESGRQVAAYNILKRMVD